MFRGVPGQGLVPLDRAQFLAAQIGDLGLQMRAAWLLGVCRTTIGAYGPALQGLSAAAADPQVPAELRALPASAVGVVQRQLGRHAEAKAWDEGALEAAAGNAEVEGEALLGLGSDAVGLGDLHAARDALRAAEAHVAKRPLWWRQQIRLDWLRAEVALLGENPDEARSAGQRAVAAAETANAPRHVAKSLLFTGVAAAQQGQQKAAVSLLARAAVLAEGLGARPLVWPSRGLLSALLATTAPQDAQRSLETARSVIRAIAAELPPVLAEPWLTRRDIQNLLG